MSMSKRFKTRKRRGFSLIETIFAILLVFLLVVVGLNFLLKGEKLFNASLQKTVFDNVAADIVERNYAYPRSEGVYEHYIDEYGNLSDSEETATYRVKTELREIMPKLMAISVEIYSTGRSELLFGLESKQYQGGGTDE